MITSTNPGNENLSSSLVMLSLARLARMGQELNLPRGLNNSPAPQVVCIRSCQTESPRAPLVLIHPVGGSILPYRDLSSRLHADRSIYAIQSQADEPRNSTRHASIESLADDYIQQLQSLNIGSRYVLGGYSLGGTVAFEMARRMQQQGLALDTLIIIDTPARIRRLDQVTPDRVTPDQLLMFGNFLAGRNGQNLRIEVSDLDSMPVDEGIQMLLDRLRDMRIIHGSAGDQMYHAIYEMARHNEVLQRQFQPQSYKGGLSLVRTIEEEPQFKAEAPDVYNLPDFGWGVHCTEPVRIKRVPGSHFHLLYPPFIRTLAAAIQKFLDEKSSGTAA